MEAAETARKAECAGVLRLHLSDPGSRAKRGTPHSASTFFFFIKNKYKPQCSIHAHRTCCLNTFFFVCFAEKHFVKKASIL